ncbi:MAG: phosphate ABC transporter permease PstA [Rhodospirillales bacterium]|jgi:phosphate transport system permease protein
MDIALRKRRQRVDLIVRGLCMAATVIGLLFLASILMTLLVRGFGGLGLNIFTEVTKAPGSGGGLLNAIVGTLIQTTLGLLIGAPIGLLAGTYLAEVAGNSTLGKAVRFVSDVLLSAPSILIGLFVYQLFVVTTGTFSALAGAFALAMIVIPIVIRTTEDMLRLLPVALREAAYALGAPRWQVVISICWRAARDGIMTGILLGVARIAGETAPLIFTSLGNLNWSLSLTGPMASLPVTIYQYAGSAFADWVELAWAGAFLISAGVLLLNIAARMLTPAKK